MPLYDSGATYDSGQFYDNGSASTKKRMAKVSLELDEKNDEQLRTFATNHKNAMAGNANFATPSPTALIFDGDLDAYAAILDDIALDEAALTSKRAQKEVLKKKVKVNLTSRGSYVEDITGGDAVKIATSNLPLQAAPTPTTSMPQPQNAKAFTGKMEGEIGLSCDAIPKTKSYLWQCRTHEDGQPPGPWVNIKPAGKSDTTATGLESGKQYAFRVQVLGPNEILSPWSDECIARAA